MLDSLSRLMGASPAKFFSCFISFSSEDEPLPSRLTEDLRIAGVNCWKFEDSALAGRGVWANIDRGISSYDKLILLCSKNSLTSGPVLRELSRALRKEDELRKAGHLDPEVLVPVRLDDFVLVDWQHERKTDVVDRVIADFRGVSPGTAAYEQRLAKLLTALDPTTWPPLA
jgi:hypothetical protein